MIFIEDWERDLTRLSDIYLVKELNIEDKAKQKALYDVTYTQQKELIKLQQYSSNLPILTQINELRNQRDIDKPTFYFITISPKSDEIPFIEFKKTIDKFIQKKNMTSYLYVYEQRGVHDLEIGRGYHFHMILKNTDKTFHRLLKETKNTFKSLLGDTCTSAIDIDARYDRDMPNTIKYLIELKQDPSKHLKQQYDVKFREKYALKPYYIKNFVL